MPDQLSQVPKPIARDRAFPWRCPRCLQKTVTPVKMPYRAKAAHDGQTYEVDIADLSIPKCSACGELVFDNGADEQIAAALRQRLQLLAPEQIREARERLGLTSQELAERLGVAEDIVRAWQEGTRIQPRSADNLMRVYFALPEVRAVLTGAGQDPALGLVVAE